MMERSEKEPSSFAVCGKVKVQSDLVTLVQDGRDIISIPTHGIERISVRMGFFSERILLRLVAGIAMCVFGYFPIRHFVDWFRYGGEIWDWQILLGSFLIYGAYVIYATLKRGFYLDVVTNNDHRKLEFGSGVERDALDRFVSDAAKLLGRNIEIASN